MKASNKPKFRTPTPEQISLLERVAFGIGSGAGFLTEILHPYRPLEMYFLSPSFLVVPTIAIAYHITHNLKVSSRLATLHFGGYLVGEAASLLIDRCL